MLGGILEIAARIFDELGDQGKALIILMAVFALGIATAIGGMAWYNLPEKAAANSAAIDSLGNRIEKVEEEVKNNADHQETISRRLEIMCRELLDNPDQCDLRFNPKRANMLNPTLNPTIIYNDETRQEMRKSGVRKLRSGKWEVLQELSVRDGGSGT